MSEEHIPAGEDARRRCYFLLRRLHSLAGIIPVGVFVIFHLTVNSTILLGSEKFQFCVNTIHLLEEAGLLVPIEMLTIFLPLLFHAVLGVVIVVNGSPNASVYRYGGNVRYTLQRATGLIAFVFIMFHVWQMHWLGAVGPLSGGKFDPHNAAVTAAEALQSSGLWKWVYALGVTATVFHLSNGIWTSLITWGITIGKRSQRIAGYCCTAFGVALLLVGLGAVYGFQTFKAGDAATGHNAAVASIDSEAG